MSTSDLDTLYLYAHTYLDARRAEAAHDHVLRELPRTPGRVRSSIASVLRTVAAVVDGRASRRVLHSSQSTNFERRGVA
jgi:hypothetical protein